MRETLLFLIIVSTRILVSQDTFSIVAVDTITGEVGSAGASCIQGSIIISDIHPGVGAIHTQSYWNAINQDSAASLMDQGYSPQNIIDWLVENDAENNPTIRQYGIIDLIDGGRSAGFTGENCFDFKGHKLGENYAIQGNILLGQSILDDMEAAFLTQYGTFEEKLMASLMAANVTGADTRCTPYGTPAISAFIRVADPDNSEDSLYMDINVNNAPLTLNPLDSLNVLYWDWKISHYILGDINFDRKTDVVDILILADHIQGYQSILEFAFNPADLNMNGALEITDLYLLVYQIIGIIGN
ncbi:MAG: hypothetical protein CMG68_02405 [Candidatus Marinimicrobia bacterium]|jgi:uncharacterized Ntn-hydrolase superfamily protein|nr:hypothetical protein [Candidatus Neomarinimicrobiota bacterium]MCH2650188.1 DUF1028 domain-containing protein [Candidatus Neomarinimicrobiota bacterium]|tara:strand:+ start:3025 stop:3924 length:900 start_codon:yes stop_codon:yes gene_type:complete